MSLAEAQGWGGSRAPARRQGLAISRCQPVLRLQLSGSAATNQSEAEKMETTEAQ